jgi:hypothetical protein
VDESAARARLEALVAVDSDPALTTDEFDLLVGDAKRADAAGNLPSNVDTAPVWQANTPYQHGDVVTASPATGRWWRCIVPGTTGSTQPAWPDQHGRPPGLTEVVDGSVTWLDAGAEWKPTWDLNAAAARGWELKAGKAAGRFDFGTDGQTFQRSQIIAQCNRMAGIYRRKITASAPVKC